ncbi:RNA-binding, CRM domain [Dillenia turbinata]|uniref:RNA-binding, CRM domain n=1 Tax=Dillenia turbinata TaxID=194707 RepID=A0AAN8Z829_9MAGN
MLQMLALKNLQRHCVKALSSLFHDQPIKNYRVLREISPKLRYLTCNVVDSKKEGPTQLRMPKWVVGWREMSTTAKGGRSMRSRVERRMRKESGKTLREIRRAKKLKKKLMSDEERLIYNLRRAKKKVALLLQKLKKYELPELPPPRHDPELLTSEQLQAYKKIGFRNKNYVPVGVRGVFGGVVQNMHLHWKFHETVQVCCDNFPKEKIKEMATMLARLSGGIVINIHNVKTIIMFRGRNYRQPKNLIPINTLTKRKALFKARFEQALESQKLNIKKIEQQLRRMGVNPEDPVAMASIQRVASTFFNAIDKKEGSPYVFRGERESDEFNKLEQSEPAAEDSDQEELDRFIADIENAADQEWAEEEAAEKEEANKIRYWNREDFGGRSRRFGPMRDDDSDDEITEGPRVWKNTRGSSHGVIDSVSDDEEDGITSDNDEWDSKGAQYVSGSDSDGDAIKDIRVSGLQKRMQNRPARANANRGFKSDAEPRYRDRLAEEDYGSEEMFSDLENAMFESDAEKHDLGSSRAASSNHRSSSHEDEFDQMKKNDKSGTNAMHILDSDAYETDEGGQEFEISRMPQKRQDNIDKADNRMPVAKEDFGSEETLSDSQSPTWESEGEEELDRRVSRSGAYKYRSNSKDDPHMRDGDERGH